MQTVASPRDSFESTILEALAARGIEAGCAALWPYPSVAVASESAEAFSELLDELPLQGFVFWRGLLLPLILTDAKASSVYRKQRRQLLAAALPDLQGALMLWAERL